MSRKLRLLRSDMTECLLALNMKPYGHDKIEEMHFCCGLIF